MSNDKIRGGMPPENPLDTMELEHDRRMYEAYKQAFPEAIGLPSKILVFGTAGECDPSDWEGLWMKPKGYEVLPSPNVWEEQARPVDFFQPADVLTRVCPVRGIVDGTIDGGSRSTNKKKRK